jgi:hypothetical protein
MLVLAMMELVAHDMHDPNNEASVKDGKERGKGRKMGPAGGRGKAAGSRGKVAGSLKWADGVVPYDRL